MGIVFAATFGLLVWYVLWAEGIKAIDGFMITLLIVLAAIIGRMLLPLLPGRREH